MGEWPKTVTSFETSDRKLHTSESSARWWQSRLEGAELATSMLEKGASLGHALREGGFLLAGSYPSLDEVFTTTELIIEHWQCRSQPGYRPCSINAEGGIFVHGHAGSWSGPYGATCSASDVECYWLGTKARLVKEESKP